jgi:hypothetical protein
MTDRSYPDERTNRLETDSNRKKSAFAESPSTGPMVPSCPGDLLRDNPHAAGFRDKVLAIPIDRAIMDR